MKMHSVEFYGINSNDFYITLCVCGALLASMALKQEVVGSNRE